MTSVLFGPATVAAPQDQGFYGFGVNRDGGATVAPPCDQGFLCLQVNRERSTVPSIRRHRVSRGKPPSG